MAQLAPNNLSQVTPDWSFCVQALSINETPHNQSNNALCVRAKYALTFTVNALSIEPLYNIHYHTYMQLWNVSLVCGKHTNVCSKLQWWKFRPLTSTCSQSFVKLSPCVRNATDPTFPCITFLYNFFQEKPKYCNYGCNWIHMNN